MTFERYTDEVKGTETQYVVVKSRGGQEVLMVAHQSKVEVPRRRMHYY